MSKMALKEVVSLDEKKLFDEFRSTFAKQFKQEIDQEFTCKVTRKRTREKAYDDDIEDVDKVVYSFYSDKLYKKKPFDMPLFVISLEDHSRLGKMAKVGINEIFRSALNGNWPNFSLPSGYAIEQYWITKYPWLKVFRQ